MLAAAGELPSAGHRPGYPRPGADQEPDPVSELDVVGDASQPNVRQPAPCWPQRRPDDVNDSKA
jgi:hypothetical protein